MMKKFMLILSTAIAVFSLASCGAETPESVRLQVRCEPADARVSVFSEGNLLQPEDDGVYLLAPGTYSYSAECEGYIKVGSWVFTVDNDPEQTLEIKLRPLEEGFGVIYTDPVIENHDFFSDYEESIGGDESD